ncbi:hypothetical protein K432DRAFT_473983 [Lepidopterella palustris CBS 459.81]|uniref:RING-type domain-containing protein n=1 Tax=Lepidopterella palustris CBS 459.81 TaxID=1314670 RepID=A0A8E2DXE7_9PEZI|nr:hypothetical protein K432DRAFT_473983 [Lepidopterella palustris CBS 459.81]
MTTNQPINLPESALWDPISTLGLDFDSRSHCIAQVKTQDRRCRNPIARHNDAAMKKLIRRLSTQQPNVNTLATDLMDLAKLAICRHWGHHEQAPYVVDRWKNDIGNLPTPEAPVLPSPTIPSPRTAPIANAETQDEGRAQNLRGLETRLNEVTRERDQLINTVEDLRQRWRRSEVRPMPAAQAFPASSETTPILTVNTNGIPATQPAPQPPAAQQPMAADDLTLPTTINYVTQSSPTEPETDIEPATAAVPNTSAYHTHTTPLQPLTCMLELDHVARRPIADICPICFDRMADMSLADLIWCKSSCGQSFHKTCIAKWESMRENADAPLNCAFCRGPWQPPCDCDTAAPSE